MKVSNCCGAATNFWEYGLCPKCKEHCDFHSEEDFCEDCGELKEECICEKETEEQKEVREKMQAIHKNYPNLDYVNPEYRKYYGQIKKDEEV